MMKHLKLYLLLFGSILSTLSCTGGGTGSEIEGRCAIEGLAVYENGKPVQGAIVRMRPAHFLVLDPSAAPFSYDAFTDQKGMFYFNTVGVDSYTIEINKSGKYGCILPLVITLENEIPIVIPKVELKPTGSIQGRINLPFTDDSLRPLICIYGLDYLEKAQVTQEFAFTGIPAGTYNLRIIPSKVCNLILELQNVKVSSDSTTDVGTLNLSLPQFFRGCDSWECDSLAVRSLLDSNQLNDVDVRSVVRTDTVSSRVTGLYLAGMKISKLTKNIGSLSKLKQLNLNNNTISKLPHEIGYLSCLTELLADSNNLQRLPDEIGFCDSLTTLSIRSNNIFELSAEYIIPRLVKLDISNNHLQAIPDAVGQMSYLRYLNIENNELVNLPRSILTLNLFEFSFRYNRLCSVSENIGTWIARFDSKWSDLQVCE
jgi:hypothetical protein